MELMHYIYLPMDERIVYKQIDRPEGFYRNKIHMHNHHELVLIDSLCTFTLINNGTEQTVSGPCILFHRAGSFHEVVHVKEGPYCSRIIFYHPQAIAEIPGKYLFSSILHCADLTVVALNKEDISCILPLFELLSERPFEQQLPLLLAIFAAIAKAAKNSAAVLHRNAPAFYIFDVIEHLQESQEPVSLSALAQRYHVSPSKLKADFKKITGMPVITYNNILRLEKARILILSGSLSQTQVAYACGFTDESYFIRAFKKQFYITPAQYRRKMKESIKSE